MRYRLRTLMILLAVLPPLLAVGWWKYAEWKAKHQTEATPEQLARMAESVKKNG